MSFRYTLFVCKNDDVENLNFDFHPFMVSKILCKENSLAIKFYVSTTTLLKFSTRMKCNLNNMDRGFLYDDSFVL